jgi:hypothetical protein
MLKAKRARVDRAGNRRWTLRKLLLAVGVIGSFGVASSAFAKPWDSPPPGTFKPEISMKIANDGRADRGTDRVSHSDPYAITAAKPAPDRDYGQARHGAPVQLKADIQLKMQHGDNREGGSALSKTAEAQQQRAANKNPYAMPHAAAIPLKTEITMKMHKGDDREDGGAKPAAQKAADRGSAVQDKLRKPMSREEKLSLCKHTGVCIPLIQGSDDSDDKTM